MHTLKLYTVTILCVGLFTKCAVNPSNERITEVIHVAGEINQCKPGDTLIIKDFWRNGAHDQDIGIYHGGPIANDEHLAIFGK